MVSLYIKVLKGFVSRRGGTKKRNNTTRPTTPICLQAGSIAQAARTEPRAERLRIP
jgi:hypothetical protein